MTINTSKLLFTPSVDEMKQSTLYAFGTHVDLETFDYNQIWRWSIDNSAAFWSAVWDFCGIIGDKGAEVLSSGERLQDARFFPDSRINYTENALARVNAAPQEPAIIYRYQDGEDIILSWQELADQVSIWEQALRRAGVGQGDHVGVYLSNRAEAVIILLASANIGAVFSSAGLEMGGDDLINRFAQVRPKILIAADGYCHGEKEISRMDVVRRAADELECLKHVILVPQSDVSPDIQSLGNAQMVAGFLADIAPQKLSFTRRDFNHPLYVLFSSGSTGKPKCFEHSAGGVLLKHASEIQLNCDIRRGEKLFYHATPSWMMWNWLVGGLACGATILLYDGSVSHPDLYAQFDFTTAHGCHHHGTAAPVIMNWMKEGLGFKARYGAEALSPLRSVFSTGAILPPSGFHYLHNNLKINLKIGSFSGGTDIVGCFVGGNAFTPTYAGQINGAMMGMDVRIISEDGVLVAPDETGELCCFNAFPSMPLRFLNDEDGVRYDAEYFQEIAGAWHHGDSVTHTAQGQYVIAGRSDATLNQGGVRIGAAALYEQIESVMAQGAFQGVIDDYAAVSFMAGDGGARTILFLSLQSGAREISHDLARAIKTAIKNNVTPYAIPTRIIAMADILKTPNGKKAEVVMKNIINGKAISNPSLYGSEIVAAYEAAGKSLRDEFSCG